MTPFSAWLSTHKRHCWSVVVHPILVYGVKIKKLLISTKCQVEFAAVVGAEMAKFSPWDSIMELFLLD